MQEHFFHLDILDTTGLFLRMLKFLLKLRDWLIIASFSFE